MTTPKELQDRRSRQVQLIVGNLRILFKSMLRQSRKVERECGLTSAMLWMMWELFARPGMKVSELANVLSIHASTCSNMLDKLEAKGLVERKRSTTDQRAVHLFLTAAGNSMLEKAPRPAQGMTNAALHNLDDSELDKLADGLTALISQLELKEKDAEFVPMFQ